MTTETDTFTPTDEDVERVAGALFDEEWKPTMRSWARAETDEVVHWRALARCALIDVIGPIIDRERRAAYEQGYEEAARDLADS